jgi:hypothetical protein
MLLPVAVLAFGQEAAPFPPEPADPWRPAWEATVRGDWLQDPAEPSDRFHRLGLQLRLRWTWERDGLRLEAGSRSAMGSDSNRDNAPRWDQQPSNGSQADVLRAEGSWATPRTFGRLGLGLQELGLVTSQALWDRDLRYLGVGAAVGVRGTGGVLQEAGLRLAAGRVRNVLGGRQDLVAGQALVKVDTGPFSWLAHADHWDLAWDAGEERLRALPGHAGEVRQRMTVDAVGASGTWHARLPLEARWFRSRNPDTGETSEEVQATAGSRERVYWPQLSVTWQRLSSTGTLYPVNGDEWWFYRRARGPRMDLSLPLPGRWAATLTVLRQRAGNEAYEVTRTLFVLTKRF